MILPYLYYCNLASAGTYKPNLQRIVTLQKRALRIVSNSTYIAHIGPIFKELKLLKFHYIHSFQLVTFMFSIENSTLPSKFNNFFYCIVKSTIMILGMLSPSVCHRAERTPGSFQFTFKVQNFIIH